jgi:FtsP/CotA-like multicopper oxidase with cupredoxin domain
MKQFFQKPLYVSAFLFAPVYAFAQVPNQVSIAPVNDPCPRFAEGSTVSNPHALFSRNRILKVDFSYQSRTDSDGRTLFCFMTPEGYENPTLHVHPGDQLVITLTNNTPATTMEMNMNAPYCADGQMTGSSVNMHFHGTNTAPRCGQDDVLHTIINSGQTFRYDLKIPPDEPPGLYWYHPHIHGLVEAALQGGASGAIIVEGLPEFQPEVAGLRQRVLVIRDQNVAGNPTPGGPDNVPSWDLTLNNVPIPYPNYPPAVLPILLGEPQLFRILNASADTQLDLQILFDGEPQTLRIVGLDGVPTGSQDGNRQGRIIKTNDILIPTAGRAEFIVPAVPAGVKMAQLVTLNINTGPDGDNDPTRPIANMQLAGSDSGEQDSGEERVPPAGTTELQRFERLAAAPVTAKRTLYFSEVLSDPSDPSSPTNFFITVDGATPVLFDPANPPAIITTQGSVEEWTIENRAQENHEFHIHQIHFLVLSQDNFEINGSQPDGTIQGQFKDMIQVPFWDGNADHPFPSVTVRMDFRGADVGDFVYHCHIAGHEDNGMMAIIRVVPR